MSHPGVEPRVCLVVCQPTKGTMLKNTLEKSGFVVDVFDNVEKALLVVLDEPYDIILSEFEFSHENVDGADFVRSIRESRVSRVQSLPVIIFVNSLEDTVLGKLKEVRASGVLAHPIDPVRLISMMREMLLRRGYQLSANPNSPDKIREVAEIQQNIHQAGQNQQVPSAPVPRAANRPPPAPKPEAFTPPPPQPAVAGKPRQSPSPQPSPHTHSPRSQPSRNPAAEVLRNLRKNSAENPPPQQHDNLPSLEPEPTPENVASSVVTNAVDYSWMDPPELSKPERIEDKGDLFGEVPDKPKEKKKGIFGRFFDIKTYEIDDLPIAESALPEDSEYIFNPKKKKEKQQALAQMQRNLQSPPEHEEVMNQQSRQVSKPAAKKAPPQVSSSSGASKREDRNPFVVDETPSEIARKLQQIELKQQEKRRRQATQSHMQRPARQPVQPQKPVGERIVPERQTPPVTANVAAAQANVAVRRTQPASQPASPQAKTSSPVAEPPGWQPEGTAAKPIVDFFNAGNAAAKHEPVEEPQPRHAPAIPSEAAPLVDETAPPAEHKAAPRHEIDLEDEANYLGLSARALWFVGVLAIAVGVAFFMGTSSINSNAEKFLVTKLEQHGKNNFWISVSSEDGKLDLSGINLDDFKDVKANCRACDKVSPIVFGAHHRAQVHYNNHSDVVYMEGVSADYFSINNDQAVIGRLLGRTDIQNRTNMAVIGSDIKKDLFGETSPIGKIIRVGRLKLTVVGVLQEKDPTILLKLNNVKGYDINRRILIPYTFYTDRLSSDVIGMIQGTGKSAADVDGATREVVQILLNKHQESIYSTQTSNDWKNLAMSKVKGMSVAGVAIAAVSFVLGYLAIMSVAGLSVVQRAKSRKRKNKMPVSGSVARMHVFVQSLVMSAVGGLIGVAIGLALNHGVAVLTGAERDVAIMMVIVGFAIAILIGLISAVHTSMRTSRLSAV